MKKELFKNKLRKSTLIWLVSCLLTVALVLFVRSIIYKNIHQTEKSAFDKSCNILSKEILSNIYGLQGMAGIIHTHEYHPSLKQVRHYAETRNFFTNFTGVLGFGYIRFVPRGTLPSYVEEIRKQKKDFEIKTLSNYQGDHFIIESIEPSESNGPAQGLDVATDVFRREAAMAASQTRKPTLTAPIVLVQAKSEGIGFLFFNPIFDHSSNVERLVGWSYAPILMERLLKSFKLASDERLVFEIVDVTNQGEPLEITVAPSLRSGLVKIEYSSRLEIAGRVWEIRGGVPDQGYHVLVDTMSLVLILALVIVLGLLIFYIEAKIAQSNASRIKLGQMESWQKAVLDSTEYSVISSDTNGVIQTFNHGAEKLLGYSAHEVVGTHTLSVFHEVAEVTSRAVELTKEFGRNIGPGLDVLVAKAREFNTTDTHEWTYVRKNRTTVPVRLSVTSIRTQDQQIAGYLGIAEDISHLKKLHSMVEIQQTSLISAAKMSALGEMAGGIAHEINNPLAILQSRISLILMRLKTPAFDAASLSVELEKLIATTERIAKIIQGLRGFSRDGTNDEKNLTSIGEIVEGTLDLCRERFRNHGVRLNLTGELDALINCRAVQISQVVMNLLNNSFDAIETKTEKWISIEVQSSPGLKKIIITDAGSGINPETAKKMMDAFFTTKEAGKGTGLGLSISSGIMSEHNGKLKYNELSANTQFVLEFYDA